MNTAAHRASAQTAEKAFDWASAAASWQAAIDNYPGKGALADADKAKMASRRDACNAMLTGER